MSEIFNQGILWTIVIGFVAGLIARAIKPGDDKMGIIMTIVLGIAGSFVARVVGTKLGWYGSGHVVGIIGSVIGAFALLVLYGVIRRKR